MSLTGDTGSGSPYAVALTPAARRDLKGLSREAYVLVRRELDTVLPVDRRPPHSAKLGGAQAYRLRVKSVRLLYVVNDKARVVTVVRIALRKAAYGKRGRRRLKDL